MNQLSVLPLVIFRGSIRWTIFGGNFEKIYFFDFFIYLVLYTILFNSLLSCKLQIVAILFYLFCIIFHNTHLHKCMHYDMYFPCCKGKKKKKLKFISQLQNKMWSFYSWFTVYVSIKHSSSQSTSPIRWQRSKRNAHQNK